MERCKRQNTKQRINCHSSFFHFTQTASKKRENWLKISFFSAGLGILFSFYDEPIEHFPIWLQLQFYSLTTEKSSNSMMQSYVRNQKDFTTLLNKNSRGNFFSPNYYFHSFWDSRGTRKLFLITIRRKLSSFHKRIIILRGRHSHFRLELYYKSVWIFCGCVLPVSHCTLSSRSAEHFLSSWLRKSFSLQYK